MVIRFKKDTGEYKKGVSYRLSTEEARKYIKLGVAQVDRMITEMRTK